MDSGFVLLPGLECKRCGYLWSPKTPNLPKVCPACKSPYWHSPGTYKLKKLRGKREAMSSQYCPICHQEFSSYLNLARHMVLKDRPDGIHQQWLQDFLDMDFADYAFGRDKYIANALRSSWSKKRSW